MAISRTKKEETVAKLKDVIQKSNTLVFVSFNGVTSNEANDMRVFFEEEGVGYFIAKKTLIKKAFDGAKVEGEFPNLEGEISIAYGEDNIAPARAIASTAKKIGGKLNIVGGIYEGKFIPQSEMQAISNIPSLEILHTQLVCMLNAPIQGFVSVLNQIAEKKA